jgi:uncharacterized SAM-binding protein YcdF (DUF218 family)
VSRSSAILTVHSQPTMTAQQGSRRATSRAWRRMVFLLRILLLAPFLLAAFLTPIALDIYLYASASDSQPADAAVVLGASAWGSRPSPVFEQRIAHAVVLYQQKKVRTIIFTGGSGGGGQRAESLVASDYAFRQGVAARDMLCEVTSHNTLENLIGASEVIRQKKLGRVLIVSDPLHMRRAVTMARDVGIDAYPSPTPTSRYVGFDSKLDFLAHEIYYYAAYLLARPFTGRITGGIDMTVQPCR